MAEPDIQRLSVDADLTPGSLEDAFSQLGGRKERRYYYLTVASQTLSAAMILTTEQDIWVNLSCEFSPDQWRLTEIWWEGREEHQRSIESPGA